MLSEVCQAAYYLTTLKILGIMINRLSIVNIAIINKLTINFNDGLNIITGTTGSGKSIIINSISYLLGAKFNKDLIRTGSNKASIEADFVSLVNNKSPCKICLIFKLDR